jgi:hypothetical protein
MPVLRRPHDRHRDLRARLRSAHASRKHDQNRHVMMTIATPQYRNARRPCRSSTGHGAARPDRQLRPLRKMLLSIDTLICGHNNLLSRRIRLCQRARSIPHNSNTASAALKSP